MERMLLFGGSFNPIHHGHLIVSRHVAEQLGVARVILVPSAVPPHKQARRLAPAADRLALCRLVSRDEPLFDVSDWEVGRPGPNYTLDTVRHFRARCGALVEVCWLIGLDSLHELETWHRATELVDECTFVTAARPGFARPDAAVLRRSFSEAQVAKLLAHVLEGPRIDIASTDVRARVQSRQSIRYLVPETVRAYIEEHGLYR